MTTNQPLLARIFNARTIGLTLYFVFLAVPLLWMLSMSFKANSEILTTRSFIP